MSNLAKGQPEWNIITRELGLPFAVIKSLRNEERRFTSQYQRIQAVEMGGIGAAMTGWTFTGTIKIGNANVGGGSGNTSDDGKLFVRRTVAGTTTIDVYRATGAGGSDKVMTATGVSNAGASNVALTAVNSSGLNATIATVAATSSDANDNFYLYMVPDWGLRALAIFDGSKPEHVGLRDTFSAAMANTKNNMTASIAQWAGVVQSFLATRWATFLVSGQFGAISKQPIINQGIVTTVNTGILEDARAAMRDETSPAAQTVVKNVVALGSATFDPVNQGQGVLAAGSVLEEWAQNGTLTLLCVDATIGQELFSVSLRVTPTGQTFQALDNLQIRKAFADPVLGIRSMQINRTALVTGGAADFATAADWTSLAGETANNTDGGKVYLKTVAVGATFRIDGYKSSTYISTSLVFSTDAAAASTVVNINPQNGSGFSGQGKIGTAPTNGNTGNINLQTFQTQNSQQGVADKITIPITVTSTGEWQRVLRDVFGYYLNSAASGAQTIAEGYVTAGTFVPFSTVDA